MVASRLKRLGRPLYLAGFLYVALAAAAGLVAAGWVGSSLIDIAVDVNGKEASPVSVEWRENGRFELLSSLQAEPAPARIGDASFTLKATGQKSSQAKASEVWLVGFAGRDDVVQSPPGSWQRRSNALVSVGEHQPSSLSWSGPGPVKLHLVKHPWSGVAELTSPGVQETLDLYSPGAGQSSSVEVLVEPTPSVRFYGQIPRRALSGLALSLGQISADRLSRVYIGTLIPTVYYSHRRPSAHVWGHLEAFWHPVTEGSRVLLPALSPLERGGALTFFALWGLLLALGLSGVVMWRALAWLGAALRRPPPSPISLSPLRIEVWAALFVPLVLVWGVIWLCFYPGLVSSDTVWQWLQINQGKLNDHHPAFTTLLLMLVRQIWDSPAAITLLQILAMAGVVSYGFVLVLRAGVPRWVVGTAYLFCLVFPQLGQTAISVVKDTPFAVILFGATLVLAQRLFKGERGTRWFWCGLGVLLAMATLFRHNGILVTVGMALLLPIFFWPERRTAALAGLTAAICLVVVKGGIYRLFHVHGRNFTHTATVLIWNIGALIDQDVPLSKDEYKFLDQIIPIDTDRWPYFANSVAPLAYQGKGVRKGFAWANAHRTELEQLQLDLFERYPLLLIRHVLRSDSYLFWIPRPEGEGMTEINLAAFFLIDRLPPYRDPQWGEADGQVRLMAKLGFPLTPRFPKLNAWLVNRVLRPTIFGGFPFGWILWRPALWLYLGLLGVVVGAWRIRDPRLLVLAVPVLLNTASLLFGVAGETRFQSPVFVSVGFMVCLAALPRRQRMVGGQTS